MFPEVWGSWGGGDTQLSGAEGRLLAPPAGPRVMGAQAGMKWPPSLRGMGPRHLKWIDPTTTHPLTAGPGRGVGPVTPRPGLFPRKGHCSQ